MAMKQKKHKGKYKWSPTTKQEKALAVQHTQTELKLHLYKAIDKFEPIEYALDLTDEQVEEALLEFFLSIRNDIKNKKKFRSA